MISRTVSQAVVLACMGAAFGAASARAAEPPPGKLTVQIDQPGAAISPMLYGMMTEEINHSYDGGLYGELIQNRSFKDDPANPVHWSFLQEGGAAGSMGLDGAKPVIGALSASLKLTITHGGGRVGAANEGYWGIPARPNTTYQASFYARSSDTFTGPLTLDLESNDGARVYAQARIDKISSEWRKYHVMLSTGELTPSAANRFVVSASTLGTVWLSQVSLFPPTYQNRANGNRIDLMQKMAAMKPTFLRLPGGNYLEGNAIAERFDWKQTIHGMDDRPGHQGPWGYRSTDGLGLLEFFEWCEDLKVEPILAVYAGYSLPPKNEKIDPGPDLAPYVQDALDEIEYATGDIDTKWGAARAADGHPEPFKIQYVEIGNEDWFDPSGSYDGRFAQFFDAIRAKYPSLKLIATMPVRSRAADLNDEHFYRSPAEMAKDAKHYDNYKRTGPKVFVGEWASIEGSPTPSMNAALGDAAWLTGLERNSDVVLLSCYAPMLVNVNPDASQWGTNLIGYDALTSFASPSYYVQKMFGSNRGDVVLPVDVTPQAYPAVTPAPTAGAVGVGTWVTQAEFKDASVTHDGRTIYQKDFTSGADDWKKSGGSWSVEGDVLKETTEIENCRAVTGSPMWSDYSYSVKARKTAGAEGFLVMFHVKDDDNYLWWNVGGWGNSRAVLERSVKGVKSQLGPIVPMQVETGRWYDVRVDVQGHHIRCFLDGKLLEETDDFLPPPPGPVITTASRDKATGDVILKVVNYQQKPQNLTIALEGASSIAKTATVEQIAGNPDDVNSIDAPSKIAPTKATIKTGGKTFTHRFPGYSVSVIRVKAE
ncbi:alpha-N-arabinofuranosidase [Capsulimonas corticalis]|uniref:non-reducing end alpha-L-arabinofuranosidase n=1 Tax=Capsulimonas corticalis TaxID=2219043 RepID=A0A402D6J1_9BACT|nr:alpha-L-arabinofuranosidase C-terminal domain-containing protein [Capsulimonas corticalis]BDI32443.1 alpha-N-arabinofuranosidase [Capsulimonas corticalis]